AMLFPYASAFSLTSPGRAFLRCIAAWTPEATVPRRILQLQQPGVFRSAIGYGKLRYFRTHPQHRGKLTDRAVGPQGRILSHAFPAANLSGRSLDLTGWPGAGIPSSHGRPATHGNGIPDSYRTGCVAAARRYGGRHSHTRRVAR